MGGTVFEKEPPGVPGNAGAGNQAGGEQSVTVETDESTQLLRLFYILEQIPDGRMRFR